MSVSHGANDWRPIAQGQAAPSFTGPAPDYGRLRKEATANLPGGGSVCVGAAEDPFFLDPRVFDLLYGGDLSEVGTDTLTGYNVDTIVLQVPKNDLALRNDPARNPVIGVWSDTERRSLQLSPGAATSGGDFVQVSRLGNPLVNEVVVPVGLKDAFSTISAGRRCPRRSGIARDRSGPVTRNAFGCIRIGPTGWCNGAPDWRICARSRRATTNVSTAAATTAASAATTSRSRPGSSPPPMSSRR